MLAHIFKILFNIEDFSDLGLNSDLHLNRELRFCVSLSKVSICDLAIIIYF